MTGLTTTQAAALLGITPSSLRSKATRARATGQEWRLPREQWPDGRTPLYDPEAIRATPQRAPGLASSPTHS